MTISTSNYDYNECDLRGYDLDAVIKKIEDSSLEGKKTALFIGRTHSEELPQKEGVVWFSLDIRNPKPQKGKEERREFHLHINFQDKERFSKIERLFDEVVVDRETYKWFGLGQSPVLEDKSHYKFSKGSRDVSIKFYHEEIAKQLISLLKPGGEEKLICDFAPRKDFPSSIELLEPMIERSDELYAEKHQMIKKWIFNRGQKGILEGARAWYTHLEKLEIQGMLKEVFKDVSYVRGKALPYRVTCTSGENSHFIAQGLKN